MSRGVRGELKKLFHVEEDFPLSPVVVSKCGCWMRTRFQIDEQAWFQKNIQKIDEAQTFFQVLDAIESVYEERWRGRTVIRRVILREMIDDLPPVLLYM